MAGTMIRTWASFVRANAHRVRDSAFTTAVTIACNFFGITHVVINFKPLFIALTSPLFIGTVKLFIKLDIGFD